MSQMRGPVPTGPRNPAHPGGVAAVVRNTAEALGAAAAGIIAMAVVAALGLWAAGAGDLPGGAFLRVVAAVVVIAAGGSVAVSGSAGALARAAATVDAVPLSVTLAGALVTAAVFLLPLRRRTAATGRGLLARAAGTAVCWLVLLLLLALAARHSFRVSVGSGLADELGAALGATPTVAFRAELPATLGTGLLWVLAVLAFACLVSRRVPLAAGPRRVQRSVRPYAYAMVLVLLAYVAIGVVVGVVVLATRGQPAETAGTMLLGLPNLAWIALGTGTGGAWYGHLTGAPGLPLPHVLDQVLRTRDGDRTLDLGALTAYDGRAWLLVAVAVVVLLAASYAAAVRRPASAPLWRHALAMAASLALTLLVVGLLTRISAHYGLALIGVGNLSGLGGEFVLRPELLRLAGAGAACGLAAGLLGGLPARGVRRSGAARPPRGVRGAGR